MICGKGLTTNTRTRTAAFSGELALSFLKLRYAVDAKQSVQKGFFPPRLVYTKSDKGASTSFPLQGNRVSSSTAMFGPC